MVIDWSLNGKVPTLAAASDCDGDGAFAAADSFPSDIARLQERREGERVEFTTAYLFRIGHGLSSVRDIMAGH